MTDKMREEFEAWLSSMNARHPERIMAPGGFYYDDYRVTDAWQVWQASRATLVIDVPDENDDRFWSLLDEPTADGNSHIFLEGTFTDAVHEAIESAGVRVKP